MVMTIPQANTLWRRNGRLRFPIDGLVLYAPLWHPELSGSPFLSKDLNAHSFSVTGAVWGSTGRILDGIDDRMACPDAASLDIATSLSILAWVNATSLDAVESHTVLTKRFGSSVNYGLNFEAAAGNKDKLQFYIHDGVAFRTVQDDTAMTTGVWHLVGATFDSVSDAVILYMDGVSSETGTITQAMVTNNELLSIGGIGSAESFHGIIGEVWLYGERVLAASEVMHIHRATKGRYI